MSHPLATDHSVICAVCRGYAGPIGFKPARKDPAIWFCDDKRCQALARKVYAMTKEQLEAYEYKAGMAAGDQAGAYLDQIGRTDLAELTREQWEEFIARVIIGFQHEMRRMIGSHEAPF
jgi:hypothetical protein